MLRLNAVNGPTGRLLREMLANRGLLNGHVQGIVNYGYFPNNMGLPILNEKAGTKNKYEELVALDNAGVTTVPFSKSALDLVAPIFGRKLHHTRGRDILAYKVRPLMKGDKLSDYYTEVIPKDKEFRVWVFRDKFLACYQKVKTYVPKGRARRIPNPEVWNWGNGYAYKFVQPDEVSTKLKTLAKNAVSALGLDFGAVDALLSTDGYYYTLEVNTAPGTQGEARQGVTSLVNHIEKWAKGGFPERE